MTAPRESSLFPPDPYHVPGVPLGWVPAREEELPAGHRCSLAPLLQTLLPADAGRCWQEEEEADTLQHPSSCPTCEACPCCYEGFVPQYNYQFGETYGKTTYRLLTDPHVRKSPRSVLAPLCKQRFIEDFSGTQGGLQPYLPGHPGYFPYERAGAMTNFPEPIFGPKPPPPGLAEEQLLLTHMDPMPSHDPGKRALSMQREYGYPSPVKIEGVTLPGVTEAVGVERNDQLPKLDVPNVIQQKVISGYTGYIPHFTWITGVNYLQGVKDAMAEFDRHQFLQRYPAHSFGKRFPQTYWPNNRIYTSAGLIPAYTGFVPHLRHTYALTFGNSTRKAYRKEQRRRACALCRILVLLVLRHQVVHVALSLCEFHLIHALACVPVQESLSAEHRSELFRDAFEQLLDSCAVTNERGRHFQATRWNVTDRCFNVIRDPFNKVAAIFVLNVQHLLIHLFHGHTASKHSSYGQIAAVTWVTRSHHVLCIKHLLR
ncbi:Protein FAM166A [Aix galericulata]|nr:Protein FAM166A [Aix galericulata]